MLSYLYSLEYEDDDEATMKELNITEVEDVQIDVLEVSSKAPSSPTFSEDAFSSKDALISEAQKRDHHRMLNNIAVHAIADKYDIPPLKEMARTKFHNIISTIRPYHEFPTVVKAAFESTPPSDQSLRSIVTNICALHVGELLQLEGSSASEMRDIGQLGFDVLSLVKTYSDQECKLLSLSKAVAEFALRNVEDKATDLRRERDSWKDKYEVSIRTLDSVIEAAGSPKTCRQCGVTGAMLVEQVSSFMNPDTILRCSKCRTKHELDYKTRVPSPFSFGSS